MNWGSLLLIGVFSVIVFRITRWTITQRPRTGAGLGLRLGWLFSMGYVIWYWSVSRFTAMLEDGFWLFTWEGLEHELGGFVFIVFYGIVIGVLPSLLVGAFSGHLVERLFAWLQIRSARVAIFIGIAVSAALISIVHIAAINLIRLPIRDFFNNSIYWSLLGIPTAVIIFTSGWAGWKLFMIIKNRSQPTYDLAR